MSTYSLVSFPGTNLPKEYEGLVYWKWLHSLRSGNDFFKLMEPDRFYQVYRRNIEGLLSKESCLVKLAVLTDSPDVVLGFSVSRETILDYVYVFANGKPWDRIADFRRMGIGKSLIPEGITTITHLTKTGLTIWGSKYKDWKFDPFA